MSITTTESDLDRTESDAEGGGCPNCGAAMNRTGSLLCETCGYYEALGKCVDIEPDEPVYENGEYVGPEETADTSLVSAVFAIPTWLWKLVGILAFVVGISFAGRLGTEGSVKVIWAIAQAAGGLLLFIVAHVRVAFLMMKDDIQLTVMGAIERPVQLWAAAMAAYPRTFRWTAIAWGAVWSVILAHLLIGIPYTKLFSGEPYKGKKRTPAPAAAMTAMAGAAAGGQDLTMEEAMDQFAAQAGATGMTGEPEEELPEFGAEKSDAEVPLPGEETEEEEELDPDVVVEQISCVIVGYKMAEADADAEEKVQSLLVATRIRGQLRMVGEVLQGLTPKQCARIESRIPFLGRDEPPLKTEESAHWLRPIMRCLVEVQFLPEDKQVKSIKMLRLD